MGKKDRQEYYIDLAAGEVTWVWFARTGMYNLRGRGRGVAVGKAAKVLKLGEGVFLG